VFHSLAFSSLSALLNILKGLEVSQLSQLLTDENLAILPTVISFVYKVVSFFLPPTKEVGKSGGDSLSGCYFPSFLVRAISIVELCASCGLKEPEKNKPNIYLRRLQKRGENDSSSETDEQKLWSGLKLISLLGDVSLSSSSSPTVQGSDISPVTTSSLCGSPSNILPFLILLASSLAIFYKVFPLETTSCPSSSYHKDLLIILREMLVVKGKDVLFMSHVNYDEDLGLMVERGEKVNELVGKDKVGVVDEAMDVRFKSLIGLMALIESKGV
jgi:hypothetical protein